MVDKFIYPEGYEFYEGKENVVNSKEITMIEIKEDLCVYYKIDFTQESSADKVELILGDYEIKEEDGKTYLIKKQPQYPKFYDDCYEIMNIPENKLIQCGIYGYKANLLSKFQQLLICRDAYWKIAGDWKPDWNDYDNMKYCIGTCKNVIGKCNRATGNKILAFPTEEIRDTFYENFRNLINDCKDLL